MVTQVEIDMAAKLGVHLNQKAGNRHQAATRPKIGQSLGQIPPCPPHLLSVMKHRRSSEVPKLFHQNSFLVTQQTTM
jgi:hypothetical protein